VNDGPTAGGLLPDTALPIGAGSTPWLLLLLMALHTIVRWRTPMQR
jgi:hypothetical protein